MLLGNIPQDTILLLPECVHFCNQVRYTLESLRSNFGHSWDIRTIYCANFDSVYCTIVVQPSRETNGDIAT